MEKMNQSATPMSEETTNLLRKAKAQPFNCHFVGLMYIHNYLMFIRDKTSGSSLIKEATQLVFIDIRGQNPKEYFEETRVFKSEWFDLPKFVNLFSAAAGTQEHEEYRDILKHKISMKYLFIIGDSADFDNETFRLFLQHIMDMDGGKPFQMFLYKFNKDILGVEYPYLCLEGSTKKHLALYPLIALKLHDIGLEREKNNF